MQIDFLISSERSGSNLLIKLLDSHSQYCGPMPAHLIRAFSHNMKSYRELKETKNTEEFIIDFLEFFNSKIGIWQATFTKEELTGIHPDNLAQVIKYVYRKEAELQNKQRVIIKELGTYRFFNYLVENFDQPRFIWLIRDPRDMALSWSRSPVHRGDIVRAAYTWNEDQKGTLELYKQYRSVILPVKYEELVSQLNTALYKICNFLGVEAEMQMVGFYRRKLAVQNAEQTESWKNLNQQLITDNFNKYKGKLSEEQVRLIEYVCCNGMTALGYQIDFPLLNKKEFSEVENKLKREERYDKPEYLLIDEKEKRLRDKWQLKFREIQNR
ncbi:MAG: sulfotransferase [Bacteroidia bacterium]|nr:sulfotransferase [Bacteroidia bacterium]